MTVRGSMQSHRLWDSLLALSLGGMAFAFLLWMRSQAAPGAPFPWLPAAVWIELFVAARVLGITLVDGEFSLSHIFLIAAILSFDFSTALWIGGLGTIVDQVTRSVFHASLHLEPRGARRTFDALGLALPKTIFRMVVAGLAYQAVGGHAPLTDLSLASAVPFLTLLVVYVLASALTHYRIFPHPPNAPLHQRMRREARRVRLIDLTTLPLPLVVAVIYLGTDFPIFVGFAIFQTITMLLLHAVSLDRSALEKRTRERASVSAIGQAISTSLDLPELLEAIHQHISPLMDARNFYVALYNEDYDELSFPLAYEDGYATRYRSRSASNGLTEYVLRTRAPLLIPSDIGSTLRRLGLENVPGQEALCWLGVPLISGDRALGMIAVQSHTRTHAYDANDVEVLATIASHTAVAIENAQLYASSRRRASELAILNSVSTVVGSSLNLDQVMEAIVASVGPVVGCHKAAILLVQEGSRSYAPTASRGLSRSFLQQMSAMLRAARGENSVMNLERQPLIVNDVRTDPRFETERIVLETEGVRAFADMPLQARDHAIGTLAVFYTEPHRFTVAELDLLTTFANQAAAAVANASLYAQTDLALARRIEEMAALEEIGRELTSSLDFNRVIERVLDAAIEFAGAARGLVALYDTDRHTLNLVAARGYPPGVLADAMTEGWHADQGVVGGAIRDRSVRWIENVQETRAYAPNDPAIQSALVVPILRDGQPLGVINLESTRRAAFNQSSATFIGQLATQAAVAIRNAQLHQQTQTRLRETSILFEVSRQVTTHHDLPELAQALTRQLAHALDTTHCVLELVARSSGALELIAEYTAPGFESIQLPHEAGGALRRLHLDHLRRDRQPVIIYAPQALDHPDDYEFLRSKKLHALIGLPLIAGNEMIGRVIWMHSRQRGQFSADDIRFAQTLANQASIAVENARLFLERTRRVNDLAQLYQASLALASSIEFEQALNRIAVIAREITDSDAVTVYLYDARTDTVTRGSHLSGSDRLSDAAAIRPDGMTRRIITTRQPAIVNDARQEPDTNPRVLEAGIRSVIGMPILRKGQVLGVLYVNSREVGKYNADSLQLVQLLANEAAVAIENAQLFSRIAEARDRLAAILNSSRDGMLMVDVSGRVTIANPMIEQLWGVRRADLEGRSLARLLESPELDLAARLGYTPRALRSLLEQATSGVHVDWSKSVFTLPGARPRSIERTGTPVLDENGGLVGWMLVLRDVTEERELQQMREDLSNMIIHDLRSPLVAILDSYELIGESVSAGPHAETTRQALDVGQRSTRKLLDLVNSLLDISRFEHGQVPVDTQFAALRPLVDNALEQLAPMLNDRGLIARNDVPAELPLVKVDEDQITRVLINLVDNAAKFSPLGGHIVVSARPGVSHNGGPARNVVCSVRDMGPGVPAEHRERIFERFVQLSDGPERRRGTGLGLAFCKMAIEAHGGSIWIEDPPDGQGTQFSFALPVADLVPTPL